MHVLVHLSVLENLIDHLHFLSSLLWHLKYGAIGELYTWIISWTAIILIHELALQDLEEVNAALDIVVLDELAADVGMLSLHGQDTL